MDGHQLEIQSGDVLPITDRVLRHGLNSWRESVGTVLIPRPIFFDLNNADISDGYNLSVDWEKKTTPEDVIIRVGCSQKKFNPNKPLEFFKPYEERVIYAIEINFLKSITEIISVYYRPVFFSEKAKGFVDNPAHSSIKFEEDNFSQYRPLIIGELRNHAKNKNVEFNMEFVSGEVEKYRNQF